jgi:hypothetical protein
MHSSIWSNSYIDQQYIQLYIKESISGSSAYANIEWVHILVNSEWSTYTVVIQALNLTLKFNHIKEKTREIL